MNDLTLAPGGLSYSTVIHEVLHGLGLAHPHDNGGGSLIFPGVTDAFGSYGDYNLNQEIYTIMSYNAGFPEQFGPTSDTVGNASTPMALDIAALQYIYGANMLHNIGDDTYNLPTLIEAGTSWESIWDAGGEDTISAVGASDWALIQLEDAKLAGPFAGGEISNVNDVVGGFTIANGVVIENAIGSDYADSIQGNSYTNKLKGEGGDDLIYGGGGTDYIWGGTGADTFLFGQNDFYSYGVSHSIVEDFEVGIDNLTSIHIKSDLSYELTDLFYDFTPEGFRRANAPDGSTLTLRNIYDGQKTGSVVVTGNTDVGSTLTIDWSTFGDTDGIDSNSLAYRWYRDDGVITGQTNSTYVITSADEGSDVSGGITYVDNWGDTQVVQSDSVAIDEVVVDTRRRCTYHYDLSWRNERHDAAHRGNCRTRKHCRGLRCICFHWDYDCGY